ncbi:MAG: relaxase domain-containing protein, partial [Rhodospirillales bacterium]|nr:relaxase domain-containing protein [Rhodospirillales bacterium]
MLSFRKGAAGAPAAARAMAEYLRGDALSDIAAGLAAYYTAGLHKEPGEIIGAIAEPRPDMHPDVAAMLGLELGKAVSQEQLSNLLQGLRADGAELPGAGRGGPERITYYDFTFSAPKSASVAMALARTDAERFLIVALHRESVREAMEFLEDTIAHARKGDGGSKGSVPGRLGYVSLDHYTARPTVEIPFVEASGTASTLIQTVKERRGPGSQVPPDPHLHTHVATPNVVVAEDGTVGSLDTARLHGTVKTIGAYYQVRYAQKLRAHGIGTGREERTGLARLTAISGELTDLFSKRSQNGEALAREYVAADGLDWDTLDAQEKVRVLRRGTIEARLGKDGNAVTWRAWAQQAEAAGHRHETVIGSAPPTPEPTGAAHIPTAYRAALPWLDVEMGRRSTMPAAVARYTAALGLIETGAVSPRDINQITTLMRSHGVQHESHQVPLVWAQVDRQTEGEESLDQRPQFRITTELHIRQEKLVITLAEAAAADRSGALTPEQITRAVALVSTRDGLDFSNEHGQEQRRAIDTLGTDGRFGVLVGVGGAGKTTLLRPLVEAHRAEGRKVFGVANARRQSDALIDAGIHPDHAYPIFQLLKPTNRSRVTRPGRDDLVVLDEVSQIGTKRLLHLLRMQRQRGFSIIAIGDDKQNQSVEAGSSVRLLRRALTPERVPEIANSVRQLRERDRETALLFRNGSAAEGIVRLQEDGHAMLVPGGHRQAVEATAELWEQRHDSNAHRPDYRLTISAPTNADARAISAAIRERKRTLGQLGDDRVVVRATDQSDPPQYYDLPLAVGDNVRLFAWTRATFDNGKTANIGSNGAVLTVVDIKPEVDGGVSLRNPKGHVGFVRWDDLRSRENGHVMLSYGDAVTIDAVQGATSTEHINALPSGSQASNSFKNYPAQSRSREATWLVVSQGREQTEILGRRALGDERPITNDMIWNNVAANLSRQPVKELA